EKGGIFSAWSDFFDDAMWQEAFAETGADIPFYTTRERSEDEIFPWDFIDAGVTKSFLLREWKRALAGEITPNCRQQCSGCGSAKYRGGVCYEK
ncbi:MAG: B12-binding domain-containing radical SAM protein, partial [Clostridiales bacterium]|nr:B12-binding domain-containing radical SAM protein [Clostridiales bacterium]